MAGRRSLVAIDPGVDHAWDASPPPPLASGPGRPRGRRLESRPLRWRCRPPSGTSGLPRDSPPGPEACRPAWRRSPAAACEVRCSPLLLRWLAALAVGPKASRPRSPPVLGSSVRPQETANRASTSGPHRSLAAGKPSSDLASLAVRFGLIGHTATTPRPGGRSPGGTCLPIPMGSSSLNRRHLARPFRGGRSRFARYSPAPALVERERSSMDPQTLRLPSSTPAPGCACAPG